MALFLLPSQSPANMPMRHILEYLNPLVSSLMVHVHIQIVPWLVLGQEDLTTLSQGVLLKLLSQATPNS